MTAVTNFLAAHPLIAIALAVLLIALIFSLLKKLFKIALIVALVILLAGGTIYRYAKKQYEAHGQELLQKGKEALRKGEEKVEKVVGDVTSPSTAKDSTADHSKANTARKRPAHPKRAASENP